MERLVTHCAARCHTQQVLSSTLQLQAGTGMVGGEQGLVPRLMPEGRCSLLLLKRNLILCVGVLPVCILVCLCTL